MKDTGIVRGIDKMGRVVIPKELRKQLKVENAEDSFAIFVEDDKIILKKYEPTCVFCNNTENTITYGDRLVCEECINKMKNQLEEEKINNGSVNQND